VINLRFPEGVSVKIIFVFVAFALTACASSEKRGTLFSRLGMPEGHPVYEEIPLGGDRYAVTCKRGASSDLEESMKLVADRAREICARSGLVASISDVARIETVPQIVQANVQCQGKK